MTIISFVFEDFGSCEPFLKFKLQFDSSPNTILDKVETRVHDSFFYIYIFFIYSIFIFPSLPSNAILDKNSWDTYTKFRFLF